MASLVPVTGNLGLKRASHLLRRATFGVPPSDIDAFANMDVDTALNTLMTLSPNDPPPVDPSTGQTWVHNDGTTLGTYRGYVLIWWVHQMLSGGTSAAEKIVFFLHSHFTSKFSVVKRSSSMYHQYKLFRYYALGNFKTLTKKITVDNAMLRFLDGRNNRKAKPNENYARELLELYSIGKGPLVSAGNYTTYTEDDIREAARVLTGFNTDETYQTIDPETGIPRGRVRISIQSVPNQHDTGDKQFSAAFQNTVISGTNTEAGMYGEIDQLIEMIYAQAATAKNICREIYRFFVHYEITPEIEQDIIDPLAQTFINQNFEIKPVFEQLFKSEHFYDAEDMTEGDENVGGLIKSPLDLYAGIFNLFEIPKPPITPADDFYSAHLRSSRLFLQITGMTLYEPQEVAGYPAYHQAPTYNRNWISSNTLAWRYKMVDLLIRGKNVYNGNIPFKLDVLGFINNATFFTDKYDAILLVTELADYIYPVELPQSRLDYFINDILLDNLDASYWSQLWGEYISSGNDNEVSARLDALFNAMLQTPEFQLM